MTLADLRRVTIKTNVRIRFSLSNGMECLVNEHGIAEVPALRAVPNFNLEEELERASRFVLEPAGPPGKLKTSPQTLDREQLTALTGPRNAGPGHEEHDE